MLRSWSGAEKQQTNALKPNTIHRMARIGMVHPFLKARKSWGDVFKGLESNKWKSSKLQVIKDLSLGEDARHNSMSIPNNGILEKGINSYPRVSFPLNKQKQQALHGCWENAGD